MPHLRSLLLALLPLAAHAAEPHWAFQPIKRPALPEVKDKAWPRNAIDHFILARLEQARLAPSPPASPATLLRRVSFGITGLPPSTNDLSRNDDAVVDQLLTSTQHGEHLARHWMDVVRYADSAGYELDYLFTHAWRYRDWLVRAFASNMPMDRFIQQQIAGDELSPDDHEAADAALFLSIGPMRFEGGIQRAKDREIEWLADVADTTGSAFLGLTMGCTRCHDHKFDPLTQTDYYGLHAIFADSELKLDRASKGPNDASPAFIRAVQRAQPGVVQVLKRGEVDLPLGEAQPALPKVLPGGGVLPAERLRRAVLARWLTSKDNPLTARVLVNRVWQWHFGHGLVRTPNDFGKQGDAPSHPELLEWLASELIASGWDLRHLEKLMLDSATYRQSSLRSDDARRVDPDDRLLCGFPRRRLQAEELRDAMLVVSGALNAKSFGPPVVPPIEPWALATLKNKNWDQTKDENEWQRRSLYLVVRRSMKQPFFDAFNLPDNISSCAARDSTVVASQALTLFNSSDTLQHARALAGRLWAQCDGDVVKASSLAWTLVYARSITDDERSRAIAFLQARETEWSTSKPSAGALPLGITEARSAAWVEWCLALLNTNEFVYVD